MSLHLLMYNLTHSRKKYQCTTLLSVNHAGAFNAEHCKKIYKREGVGWHCDEHTCHEGTCMLGVKIYISRVGLYCTGHSCESSGCLGFAEKRWCENHRCAYENCIDKVKLVKPIPGMGPQQVCGNHQCIAQKCYRMRGLSSAYCHNHRCPVPECSKGYHCPLHVCRWCKEPAMLDVGICANCVCSKSSCLKQKIDTLVGMCREHAKRCDYTDFQGGATLVAGCARRRRCDMICNTLDKYCERHTCAAPGCKYPSGKPLGYCELHVCQDILCDKPAIDGLQLCVIHHCNGVTDGIPCTGIALQAFTSAGQAVRYCHKHTCVPWCRNQRDVCLVHKCSLCTIRSTKFNCHTHSCSAPNCTKGTTMKGDVTGAKYCDDHVCREQGCNFTTHLGYYCIQHRDGKCAWESKVGATYCAALAHIDTESSSARGSSPAYCTAHTCKCCDDMISENSQYCTAHTCSQCMTHSLIEHGDCAEHSCAIHPGQRYIKRHSCELCIVAVKTAQATQV